MMGYYSVSNSSASSIKSIQRISFYMNSYATISPVNMSKTILNVTGTSNYTVNPGVVLSSPTRVSNTNNAGYLVYVEVIEYV